MGDASTSDVFELVGFCFALKDDEIHSVLGGSVFTPMIHPSSSFN